MPVNVTMSFKQLLTNYKSKYSINLFGFHQTDKIKVVLQSYDFNLKFFIDIEKLT
jgi:hypothetical protein